MVKIEKLCCEEFQFILRNMPYYFSFMLILKDDLGSILLFYHNPILFYTFPDLK